MTSFAFGGFFMFSIRPLLGKKLWWKENPRIQMTDNVATSLNERRMEGQQ